MKIALDAMGGDFAPAETVGGAIQAAREYQIDLILVGDRPVLESELAKHRADGLSLEIVHADDVIRMGEQAVQSVRSRPQSSIVVGTRLVHEGRAAAIVSAGHSGAAMAAALFVLGRIHGVERPALSILFPGERGWSLVLDVGANVDCRPEYLTQFALMGSAYAEHVLGIGRPRVGLLSNGEEDTKGNQLTRRAHQLLREQPLHFIGNVEGRDLPMGAADVVVCDGFVGNVALKTAEGVAECILRCLRDEIGKSWRFRLAAGLLRPAFRQVKRRMDYEEYGGSPLLGVNGAVIVAHGRSRAKAIKNALRMAREAALSPVIDVIRRSVESLPATSGVTASDGGVSTES
ncbi:MAG: phosphate acyltransferase PlsX [Chloroflexi bacterium]|nr:phosphate acyltransferase PlsX [Chloroflexota bacterium]